MTGKMAAVGADAVNYDTTAPPATVSSWPRCGPSNGRHPHRPGHRGGMAAECVLGFHGELTYDG